MHGAAIIILCISLAQLHACLPQRGHARVARVCMDKRYVSAALRETCIDHNCVGQAQQSCILQAAATVTSGDSLKFITPNAKSTERKSCQIF